MRRGRNPSYQGRVPVAGPPVNFDGSGAFKVAFDNTDGTIAAAARTANGSKACCVSSPYFLLTSYIPKCDETTAPNRMR